ncbi:prominin-1-A, partial [Elysia marginata]
TYKDNERCVRMGLTQALVLMLICVFSATVCIYIANETFTDALHFTNQSLVSNVGDIGRFLNNTGRRFQYLVTDMYDLIHAALQKDLANLGNLAEADIFANLRVYQVADDIAKLDDTLWSLSKRLNQTISDVDELQTAASRLAVKLGSLADDIDATTSSTCPSSCSPDLCSTLDTSSLRQAVLNVTTLPDINSTFAKLEDIRSENNFTVLASSALSNLEGISNSIDGVAVDIKTGVNSSLMKYYDLIHGLSDGVFKTMTEAFPTQNVIDESTDIMETVMDYDKYRRYFGLAFSSVFLVLVLLYTIGVILGIAFYDDTALPTERSAGSNLGGNILLIGVGLTFILGTLFMVLTIFAFLFGALLEKGCEPVEDLGYFKEFLDKGKAGGYDLSDITLGVKSLDLNTYDVLVGCRADLTPWAVLKMSEVVPLEDYLVYINYVGTVAQQLASLQTADISMFKFATSDLSQALGDLQTIGPNAVDFSSITNVLQGQPVSINFTSTLTQARNIQQACTDPAQAEWSNYISRMESIEENEAAAVQLSMRNLAASASALESDLKTFQESTRVLLQNAAHIDFQIQNNMTSVLLQSSVGLAGRMFAYLDSYAIEVVDVIYNSLGNCRPLWNLYKSFSIVLCDYGVDTLNGYWFSIGWGLFFFIPMVVVAALLANHYKTMDAEVGYQEFDDIIDGDEDSKAAAAAAVVVVVVVIVVVLVVVVVVIVVVVVVAVVVAAAAAAVVVVVIILVIVEVVLVVAAAVVVVVIMM